jgi:hypothetical protein
MTEDQTPEADDRSRALIRRFQSSIELAIEDNKSRRKRNAELAKYVRGVQGLQDETRPDPEEVRANLILGIIQTLVPMYYAKDPEIDASPEEQIQDQSYAALGVFCQTLEIVLNRLFIRDGRLKKRMTRAIPSAMTNGVAWIKVSYQRDYWQDPIIQNRIADAQDNLARIRKLTESAESQDGGENTEADEAELEQQIAALQEQVEVLLEEGLVLDFVADQDILILDDGLTTFSEYPQSRAIAHQLFMTTGDFEERFGKKPTGKKYGDRREAAAGNEQSQTRQRGERQQFVRVFEIWDRRSQTIYTMEDGAKAWARDPYRPQRLGRRWYPFFGLYWNEVDGQFYPIPDVEQWTGLQDEYNAMRTQLAQARKENRPGFAYRKGGALTDEDVENLANRRGRQFVGVTTTGSNAPLQGEIVPFPQYTIDGNAYDSTPILRDLEQTSGASDASRASINKAKTATEAEIQAMGMQSRTAYRQDVIEDVIGEMAEYAAQILLQELTPEQVERIAGAGSVWPAMPRDEIFDLVSVRIRGGSTGKPNRHQEREQWVQLAPQIISFMQQVQQFRQMGLNDQAEGVIELLRETLKRFDERLDIEKYFPPLPPPQVDPMAGMGQPGMALEMVPSDMSGMPIEPEMAGGLPVDAFNPAGMPPASIPQGV